MRTAQFRSLFDVKIVEKPSPSPARDEVLVRDGVNAICASDARYIEGGHPNPGQLAEVSRQLQGAELTSDYQASSRAE